MRWSVIYVHGRWLCEPAKQLPGSTQPREVGIVRGRFNSAMHEKEVRFGVTHERESRADRVSASRKLRHSGDSAVTPPSVELRSLPTCGRSV
jgi:hypothetical protein